MKQTFDIPAGCNKVTIEKVNNTIVTTFEPEFKQGDVVVINTDYVIILDRIDAETGNVCSHCYHDKTKGFTYIYPSVHDWKGYYIRLATDKEKQLLIDAFKFIGMQWNPEKLELEKIKWVPKKGEYYWTFMPDGVFSAEWSDSTAGNKRLDNGFIFKTKQEAETFLNKVIELAKNKQ